MAPGQHHHRAHLTQTNKPFKSKHASKSTLKDASKGRTMRQSMAQAVLKKKAGGQDIKGADAATKRLNRKNHAKQIQHQKIQAVEELAKLFNRKGADRVARVVAVIPLTADVTAEALVQEMLDANNLDAEYSPGVVTVENLKFHNQNLRFLLLPSADQTSSFFPIMDACSAADFVIFGLSSEVEVGYQAETVLRSLTGMGVGSAGCVLGLVNSLPTHTSTATSTRASLLSYLNHFFPSIERILCTSSSASEASTIVRTLCEKIPKGVRWREKRPRVLAEKLDFQLNAAAEAGAEQEVGTLAIEGVVRGARLSANRLVHLAGYGDFQVERITSAPQESRKGKGKNVMTETTVQEDLSVPDEEDADDLQSTNVPDDEELLMAEQTWPTEEEIANAPANRLGGDGGLPDAKEGTTPKRLKKVPRGTSTYQAAWIIDDEDEDDGEMEDDSEDEETEEIDMDAPDDEEAIAGGSGSHMATEEDTASMSGMDGQSDAGSYDSAEEADHLRHYLAERAKDRARENKDDLEFPDEVDTPLHQPARERFARYRGLKSFKTSPWDPYEELPQEYSRCFMFQDFKGMGKRLERKAQVEGIEPGTRVILYIKNVPLAAFKEHQAELPLVVYGLLKHEHKYSVANFTVQRNTEYDGPVRSKDDLVVMLGPRRYAVNPIFSQHTVKGGGRGANNVHKFERYLRHSIAPGMATCYVPITYGNVPAVTLRLPATVPLNEEDKQIHLVGTGSLFSCDPTRIAAKRIILSGHPYKVHRKTATIRYMFFNQADIEYFKPVQLRTKRGRTGHIKMSLGTHGMFKAGFDGGIDQMDTIMLNLYKRCFPKWSRQWTKGMTAGARVEKALRRDDDEMAMED